MWDGVWVWVWVWVGFLTCARCFRAEHSSSVITWSSSTRWVPFKDAESCTSCTPSYSRGPPPQSRVHRHTHTHTELTAVNVLSPLLLTFSELSDGSDLLLL